MLKGTPKKPLQKSDSESNTKPFQARVDYVAKALKIGTWGRKFDECFERHDSNHLVAVIMMRAEKNPELKKAIMDRFKTKKWSDVPWHDALKQFRGKTSTAIGKDAVRHCEEMEKTFSDFFEHPKSMI